MINQREHLVLGAYASYGAGHHAAAWRHPESNPHAIRSLEHYINVAKIAENYKFDFLFLSDAPAVFNDDQKGYGGRVTSFEPLTLLSALAAYTSQIGLVATSSTTYKYPYNVAREYASLDHISGGRAAWNLVTTSKIAAAGNFGEKEHLEHSERYKRAEEFVEIVKELWDSWGDDAYIANKESGIYYDVNKRRTVNFDGNYLKVWGQLNVPRPIQGYPVLVQAGSSESGRELAARTADIIFTAQRNFKDAQRFYSDIDARRKKHGRKRRVLVLPGLTVYSAESKTQAEEEVRQLQNLIEPEFGLSMLGDLIGGYDLSGVDVDGKLPELPESNANTSRRALIEEMSRNENLTVKQIYEQMTTSRGHLTLVGTHDEVADTIEKWFKNGAADGFNIMPPLSPGGFSSFGENIIPRLIKKGIFKEEYSEGTLREKLLLDRPKNQFFDLN